MVGGDIVIVIEDEEIVVGEVYIEIVGILLFFILVVCWLLDEELFVIVIGDVKVFFMSWGFDVILEVGFSEEDLRLLKYVFIGWGKKEI